MFPAGVRSPGVCSGRGVPATPVAGASSLWSPAEGVHFKSHILIFLKEGKRGQKEALVLRYIIKWRFSFLKEQKEAKDSLIETSRLLLQQWPEQVGQGRLPPLAGGGPEPAGPWSLVCPDCPPLEEMACLAWEPPLCILLGGAPGSLAHTGEPMPELSPSLALLTSWWVSCSWQDP